MKQTLKLHGRTHAATGSDPIPGITGIRFDYDNQGGYLEITARGSVPGGGDNAIEIYTLAEDGGSGDFDITTEGHFLVESADAVILEESTNLNQIQIGGTGIVALLSDGATFVIKDHLGAALVTYTG